jgi:hypothetical protein
MALDQAKEMHDMRRSDVIITCLCVLSVALLAGLVSVQSALADQGQGEGQIEEIELAPGVWVPVNMWEDDYVPTLDDLIALGMAEDDAQELTERRCTWGQIKLCSMGYYEPPRFFRSLSYVTPAIMAGASSV